MDYFTFTRVTTPSYVRFIYRDPPLPETEDIYHLPFDSHTWIAYIFLIVLINICFYCTLKIETKIYRKTHTIKQEESVFSQVTEVQTSILLQQGITFLAKSFSTKTLVIFTSGMVLFLYTSYSAYLVALLQSSSQNIRSLKDLLESNIQLGAEEIVYNHFYFKVLVQI